MNEQRRRYEELMAQLHEAKQAYPDDEELHETICEALDIVWYQLSQEDVEEILGRKKVDTAFRQGAVLASLGILVLVAATAAGAFALLRHWLRL